MYVQKWYSNSTLVDAANKALQDNPGAVFILAEVQENLFGPQTDVLVTVEIGREK